MALSDIKCRTAKPKQKPYKLADSAGLYLEVTPHGSKLWRLKYRYAGKEKRLALGAYPEISLAEAREGRDKARKLLAAGQDPSFVKQEERRLREISMANTFEALAREWHERNQAKWSENHAKTVMRRFEMDLFPVIGNIPLKDITTPRLASAINSITKRGAHEMARRSLQYCQAVFSYAKVLGKVDTNPADIKSSDVLISQKTKHHAALSAQELPDFLSKLHRNDGRQFRQTQLAIQLLMLTFVRPGELAEAKWKDLDFKKNLWTIPGEQMKMGKDHIVPLSKQSLQILEELKNHSGNRDYVFPSQRNPRNPMSNNTIRVALINMGYKEMQTAHGFRAVARTILREELNYDSEFIEKQLSHKTRAPHGEAYDRTTFLPQRTEMMQSWADHLDKLAMQGKVVSPKFGNSAT